MTNAAAPDAIFRKNPKSRKCFWSCSAAVGGLL
jgi:hypothetical protein